MIHKLESCMNPRCNSRVSLYFSSESHIHALRNVLLLSGIADNRTVATTLDAIELNYLSHGQSIENKHSCSENAIATAVMLTTSMLLSFVCLSFVTAVFRLYEDVSKPLDDPLRYYVNVQFSPGAALDPHIFTEEGHTLPVSRPVPINGRIPFHIFKAIFLSLSDTSPPRGYTAPWTPNIAAHWSTAAVPPTPASASASAANASGSADTATPQARR